MGRFRSNHVVPALMVAASEDGEKAGIVMPWAQHGSLYDFMQCVPCSPAQYQPGCAAAALPAQISGLRRLACTSSVAVLLQAQPACTWLSVV